MRAALCAMILLLSTAAPAQTEDYFPKNALGSSTLDASSAGFYSAHLKFLYESSLFLQSRDRGAQSYRFLWLRTFQHAAVIRLDVLNDGTGTLIRKMSSGGAGFGMPDRKVIEDVSRPVSRAEVQSILKVLDDKHVMAIPSYVSHDQTPCSHSGPGKEAVCAIGRALAFDLGHLNIPKDEVY